MDKQSSESDRSSLSNIIKSNQSGDLLTNPQSISKCSSTGKGCLRERSRSSDVLDRSSSSYQWRKNFENSLKEDHQDKSFKSSMKELSKGNRGNEKKDMHKTKQYVPIITENFNQQSPSMNILQIQLNGETRLMSNKTKKTPLAQLIQEHQTKMNMRDLKKVTNAVNIQGKRKIFEEKVADIETPRQRGYETCQADAYSQEDESERARKSWNTIREAHCPVTSELVKNQRGEEVRKSILVNNKKISFNNIKFHKPSVENTKVCDVSGTKEFEDRATAILQEMRKQRRTLQMEYVATVTLPTTKKVAGWRDKVNNSNDQSRKQNQIKLQENNNEGGKVQNKGSVRTMYKKESERENKKNAGFVKTHADKLNIEEAKRPEYNSYQNKFSSPLDFILMKEELAKKPGIQKKTFVKERTVESESEGEMSVASVMKSLKKIVKAINPKREFPSDRVERERQESVKLQNVKNEQKRIREEILKKASCSATSWDERMKKYHGANLVPFNKHSSRWTSCQDLMEEQRVIGKKAVRGRIQHRVLSSVHHGVQNCADQDYVFCDTEDFSVKGRTCLITVCTYKLAKVVIENTITTALECAEFRRQELPDIIAHVSKEKEKEKLKKKAVRIKPTLHGLTDSKLLAVIVRNNIPWETVKPFNVAVKKKTELFAPKSSPISPGRAKVIMNCLSVAMITSPGTCGTTAYCEQHKWNSLKGCALFTVAGQVQHNMGTVTTRLLIINMPLMLTLAEDTVKEEQVFTKCERKPQSQLVQVKSIII